ncbi:MAG: hypothetical protein ACI309_07605 [Candidatus Limisoma sp.]
MKNKAAKDYINAFVWFFKSALQGLAEAQDHIGFCFAKGYGIAIKGNAANSCKLDAVSAISLFLTKLFVFENQA